MTFTSRIRVQFLGKEDFERYRLIILIKQQQLSTLFFFKKPFSCYFHQKTGKIMKWPSQTLKKYTLCPLSFHELLLLLQICIATSLFWLLRSMKNSVSFPLPLLWSFTLGPFDKLDVHDALVQHPSQHFLSFNFSSLASSPIVQMQTTGCIYWFHLDIADIHISWKSQLNILCYSWDIATATLLRAWCIFCLLIFFKIHVNIPWKFYSDLIFQENLNLMLMAVSENLNLLAVPEILQIW